MFHLLSKLIKDLIAPLLLFLILSRYQQKKGSHMQSRTTLLCRCFLLSSFGIGNLVIGCIQTFNPSYTASLLNVPMDAAIVISELGCMHLGIGLIGSIGFFRKEFAKPAVMAYGLFMIGAIVLHLQRLAIIETGELISLLNDIWIIILAILILIFYDKDLVNNLPETNQKREIAS